MLTQEDKTFLAKKGISEEKLNAQLECFKTGFPWLKLAGAASPGNGITIPSEAEKKDYLAAWDAYLDGTGKVLKFVPASGAASRMFKNLFEFLDNEEKTDFIQKFEDNLDKFAFIDDLKAAISKNGGDGSVKTAIATLLGEEGLSASGWTIQQNAVWNSDTKLLRPLWVFQHLDESIGVTTMESDARLVKDIKRAHKTASQRCREVDSLTFSTRESVRLSV